MTAPGNSALIVTLLAMFVACTGYAAGRLHQWYRTEQDREVAYRDGYDTAARSTFSLAARLVGPRRDKAAVRASATVHTSAAASRAEAVPTPGAVPSSATSAGPRSATASENPHPTSSSVGSRSAAASVGSRSAAASGASHSAVVPGASHPAAASSMSGTPAGSPPLSELVARTGHPDVDRSTPAAITQAPGAPGLAPPDGSARSGADPAWLTDSTSPVREAAPGQAPDGLPPRGIGGPHWTPFPVPGATRTSPIRPEVRAWSSTPATQVAAPAAAEFRAPVPSAADRPIPDPRTGHATTADPSAHPVGQPAADRAAHSAVAGPSTQPSGGLAAHPAVAGPSGHPAAAGPAGHPAVADPAAHLSAAGSAVSPASMGSAVRVDPAGARPDQEAAGQPTRHRRGRHFVPDELVRAATYRLSPDRVARAKVRGPETPGSIASPGSDGPRGIPEPRAVAEPPRTDGPTGPAATVPKPRAARGRDE